MNRRKDICILEFPSNLGLKETSPGHEPGVKQLPAFLRKHGFHSRLGPVDTRRLDPPPYSMELDEATGVRNAGAIIEFADQQASLLQQVLAEGRFPIVLGGDCSILIGNAVALKRTGNYGLFFLDGHTDFMWPSLSQTGGAAGMDLAIVTGHAHDRLCDIGALKPYFKEDHAWCVGNRDLEDWYVDAIRQSSIRYIDLDTLRTGGVEENVSGFLEMITQRRLDGFWLHIDVDVLDDEIMPAVDSRQPGGLSYDEFNQILRLLLADSRMTGLEITILDPELDPEGLYTRAFVENFWSCFGS